MEEILLRISKNKMEYDRTLVLIAILPEELAQIVGDRHIHVSAFIIAKILGEIPGLNSHREITHEILLKLPETLRQPIEILEDIRNKKKYLFIGEDPILQIVVEIKRSESGKSEINTIHRINLRELKRLERKFPVVYSVGGAPSSSSSLSQQGRLSGVNLYPDDSK